MTEFVVHTWTAWAPGIEHRDDRLLETGSLSLPECVPKLLHRRLSPLAKAVLNVAHCCSHQESMPVVFSSAHGEICKSLTMLKTIQAGEALSPTAFSLSVHNAIAGLYSIAFNNNKEITVIASGQEGIAPAFVEAIGMLAEGENEVMLILYDEPIADFYPTTPFKLNSLFPCVLGLKITLNSEGLRFKLSRTHKSSDDGEHPLQLIVFINFLLSQQKTLILGNQGHSWIWQKQ